MVTWVYAGVNRSDKLPPELLSRFITFNFETYTREEFLEVALEVITKHHGKDAALARVKRRVNPKHYQLFDFIVRKEWDYGRGLAIARPLAYWPDTVQTIVPLLLFLTSPRLRSAVVR